MKVSLTGLVRNFLKGSKKSTVVSKSYFPTKDVSINSSNVPEGWFVYEMGQSPVHGLWYCVLFHYETKEHVAVEECDTAQEALDKAILLTTEKDYNQQTT